MEIKLPLYDLLNRFLIGLVFIGCIFVINLTYFTPYIKKEYFEALSVGPEVLIIISVFAVTYEIGLVINRIGSVFIEPFLIKTKLIHFNHDYKRLNEVKEKYPIIEILSREYALSRTSIVLFFLLAVISLFGEYKLLSILFIMLSLVFFLSLRKYAYRITNLME